MASKDLGVAHTLARHFFWSQNILWKDELYGRRVTVILAGRDLIVDTETVGAYLSNADDESKAAGTWKHKDWAGEGLDVVYFKDLDHAQVFERKDSIREVLAIVLRYLEIESHSQMRNS